MLKWFKKKEKANEEIIINDTNENKHDGIDDIEDTKEEIYVTNNNEPVIESMDNMNEDSELNNFNYVEEKIEKLGVSSKKLGFFDKLKAGLTKTRDDISNKIDGIIKSYKKIDEELYEDLEEVLVTADVGMNTTMELIDRLKERVKEDKVNEPEKVKDLLKDEIQNLMLESVSDNQLNINPSPAVMLVVGVNGVGKTTTIGKLSNNFKLQGKKVLIAAGDTFRAAAIEQLEEWSNRAGVEFIAHTEGAEIGRAHV